MKIAFISYEYPPDTSLGGIATYVYQVSRLMRSRGHHVEIFSSSPYRCGTETEDGVLVHRLNRVNQGNFPALIGKIFAERHQQVQFDVIEGPDLCADARGVMQFVPDIPLVVKLHTPAFLIKKLSSVQLFFHIKVRHSLNLIRKGINPIDCWYYNPKLDPERDHALDADEVVILTESMVDQVVKPWGLDAQKVSYIPNPYIPSEKLLSIPIDTRTDVVTFLGRLETRKGVIDLAKAIPLVLKRYPKATFRFVGRSKDAPNLKRPMREHLEQMLQPYRQSVEFIEGVPLDEIPSILASTDICIFPSIWENFPNVCLEAMAAGRGVVGSSAGGMTEMLDNGKAGRLAPPRNPREIANAVIELLENPELRMQLGQIARDRLLSEYNADRIGTLLEASYTRAIERRHAAGSRHPQASASFR